MRKFKPILVRSPFLHPVLRFNISTPAFQGCMKNLKKTSGVVRLNDTVGVTKKCSEDWKVSGVQDCGAVPQRACGTALSWFQALNL